MTTDENDNTGPEVELFDAWVNKNYGGNSRTKTITNEKYARICKLIRGEDPNSNAKFRFWVRNKGFRLLRHDKLTDEILDDPSGSLFVSLHAKESSTPMGERSIEKFLRTNLPAISFFRKVAIVEEFYGIIKCSHVDDKGVHAGQKKTYRLVSDTYAFLPREVITFYLLNCKTCKPRIQKYGPIPSKIRLNNLGPRKNGPTKEPAQNYTSPETEEGKEEANMAPHQVIRPSPKRYRPTFVDMPGEERYSKVPNMEYKDHGSDEPPLLKILDGRVAPPPRREYSSPPYSSHSPPKIVEGSTPRKQEEEKCPKNYYYYPTSYIVANPSPRMEPAEYELIPERAQEEIDCMMTIRRERIQAFEREVLQGTQPPSYSYMHPDRNPARYFHGGCRMQPYKLHDKYHGDTPQTFRKVVYETRHDRDIVASARKHYDSSAYAAYMAGHRRMEIEKITDAQRAHEDSWNCIRKASPELRPQHDNRTLNAEHRIQSNDIRELYGFDYANERSRLIAQRKENDYYSVHQYHRVVCDTVNSSLASLCYISEDEKEGGSQSLRIPDPSKISKVLQETNSDKLPQERVDVKILDVDK